MADSGTTTETDAGPATAAADSGTASRPTGSYSRFVGWMRVVLPVVAGAIVILVVLWPQLGDSPQKFKLGLSGSQLQDNGEQQILNPRYTGTDEDNQPFAVSADTAYPSEGRPDLISLAGPKADITTNDGAWIAISANTGLYNRQEKQLDLTGAVNLFHDNGHELRTTKARIFFDEGKATGNDAVEGQGPLGTIQSGGFIVLDRGERLIFTGKAKLVLYPAAKKEKG